MNVAKMFRVKNQHRCGNALPERPPQQGLVNISGHFTTLRTRNGVASVANGKKQKSRKTGT
jgi:hypothetical protein